MTALALEIDQKLRSLDPATAAKCERIVRDMFDLLPAQAAVLHPASKSSHELPSSSMGLEPDAEQTKPTQAAEDYIPTFEADYLPGVDRTKFNQLAWED